LFINVHLIFTIFVDNYLINVSTIEKGQASGQAAKQQRVSIKDEFALQANANPACTLFPTGWHFGTYFYFKKRHN